MRKILIFLFSLLLMACSENEILNNIDTESMLEDSIFTVKINVVGDVLTSETPLSRALTESTNVMGIIVYQNDQKYTSGLFDCWDNISLKLKAGSSYSIYCTMITDAKNVLNWRSERDNYYWNYYPFYHDHGNGRDYNIFNYGREAYATKDRLSDGRTTDKKRYTSYGSGGYCGQVERFYTQVTDYIPTVDGVLDLPLKRVSFGIKVKVSGITDGSVSVTCKNEYNTFYSNSNITTNMESEGNLFSMYNILDAWKYADTDYQEAVSLQVIWTRGNGIVQDLGTKTAYVKRNVMNIIKIKLSTNDSDVDVDVDPEEGDMGKEDEDLSN